MNESIKLPTPEILSLCESEEMERFVKDCFEILRNRGDMIPYLESDDINMVGALQYILDASSDSELEDIYYIIEDTLFERGVL